MAFNVKNSKETSNVVRIKDYLGAESDSVDNSEKLTDDSDILTLPTQLVNYRNKNFLFGFGILSFGLAVSVAAKDVKVVLLLAIFSMYFFVRAAVVARHYASGRIVELVAVCTGIKPSQFRDRISVSFMVTSEANQTAYFKFNVPSRRSQDDFIVGASYVIYFDKTVKNVLIGYIQLGMDELL